MSTPARSLAPSGPSSRLWGSAELLPVAARLASEGTAFALITVVRAVRPTSGQPGDKAILTESGEWFGWVGGSCAEPTARRAARAALEDGQCRLIHLTNDETDFARSGVEVAAMTCHSGGSLELYVEPHLPQPSLVVFGHSPIARAVCELGAFMKYRVAQVTELGLLPERASFVVVASHGQAEVEVLGWALRSGASYVGLIASQRRWDDVRRRLSDLGPDQLARLRAPAGLRIRASAPEEVALSVLSEIVAESRGAAVVAASPEPTADELPAAQTHGREEPIESCCAPRVSAPSTSAPRASGKASPSCCDTRTDKAPTFSAVVLAAGLSRRMGAPNKLLLPVRGQPMIRQVLESVLGASFVEVVVVLGHEAPEVAAAINSLGVRSIVNDDFASGQVSSVRAGLGALKQRTDAVMICLGDQPLLTTADLLDAQSAFARRSHGSVLVPMYGEQRGNPVIVDWPSAQETLARGTHFGCRHFMQEHPDRVYAWQSQNEHFVRDIDQPAEYQALLVAPPA